MAQRTPPLRVFLADDSPLIRSRIRDLLEGSGMAIVGEGTTPRECIAGILESSPDVVVLDVQLDGGPGLQVLRAVRQAAPQVAFVVFSNNTASAYRTRYLHDGALGFLDKSTDSGDLPLAVTRAAAGAPAHTTH